LLAERGIATTVYYPVPLHLQPMYASLDHKRGDFPVSEKAADEVLSLPLYPELTPEQVERVAGAIIEAVRE
jgi:dTDP-4-amino-4,6-dideoxygalactose transaminase